MDTNLARTFLSIVETGSFNRAAERLNISQTAVSARIKVLEEQLGRTVFVRNKAGAVLTPAGEQFLRHAPTFVQVWERARQQVAVPEGHREVLAIGGEPTLWHPLLLNWTVWMRRSLEDVAVRVHVDLPNDLVAQVADGLIDIGVVYAPQHRSGLIVDLVMEEKLVLVTSVDPAKGSIGEYVHVDWGPEFALRYHESFPTAQPFSLIVGLGPLALKYILEVGGSAYLRMNAIKPWLDRKILRLVPDAPQFSYPVYAVYSAGGEREVVADAISGLRTVAALPPSTKIDA